MWEREEVQELLRGDRALNVPSATPFPHLSPRSLFKKIKHRARAEPLCKPPGGTLQDNAGPIFRARRSIQIELQTSHYWYLTPCMSMYD